jgi:hypothetical protein
MVVQLYSVYSAGACPGRILLRQKVKDSALAGSILKLAVTAIAGQLQSVSKTEKMKWLVL